MRSDQDDTHTSNTKDSGYSNSCSNNSQSQRSSGSSKSRNSISSGSSGYSGLNPSIDGKKKEHKKKKKSGGSVAAATITAQTTEEGNTICPNREEATAQDAETGTATDAAESFEIAVLSQTLASIKKIKYRDNPLDESPSDTVQMATDQEKLTDGFESLVKTEPTQEVTTESKEDSELGLKIAVSMTDGIVVHTLGLTKMLGYPNEMWTGRSLIDFVHPNHRAAFAGRIISTIAELRPGASKESDAVFFCCLRIYRGLKSSGFGVANKPLSYLPCRMSFELKELTRRTETPMKEYLIITAFPVHSAYEYPSEMRMSPKFTTRHSVTCQFLHVDPIVTQYFGYLPQDMISRSVLDFYHPEDLHFLKEVYEAVAKEQGHPFRSKPYRFRCQNGGYCLIETELSSFVNPWTRKLEFIIGQHSVLRGPPNPDVTTPLEDPEPLKISEEILKESKIVQEEIKCLLNKRIVTSTKSAKQQVAKRCKDLATFMENLVDEMGGPEDLKVVVPVEEQSFSERDSVMLGEISPHHDYYDSKSSSETPPSYNQLNYNENIHRFFDSQPKTTISSDSGESKNISCAEEAETGEVGSSLVSKSGESGSTESAGNSGGDTSNDPGSDANAQVLTEKLLSRHNEDMEKIMVQKHRELRSKSDRDSRSKGKSRDDLSSCAQGIKRSGSQSFEGEPLKAFKSSHPNMGSAPGPSRGADQSDKTQTTAIWSPFALSLASIPTTSGDNPSPAPNLMPMYYLAHRPDQTSDDSSLCYPSMFCPVLFRPPQMVHQLLTESRNEDLDQRESQIRFDPQSNPRSGDSAELRVTSDDSSFYSSFYSSFHSLLKSDEEFKSSSENEKPEGGWESSCPPKTLRPIKKVAPWIDDVNMTPDVVYNYQLEERVLSDVLEKDKNALESFVQPNLVNDQLGQMYIDMELEGLSRQLTLDEGLTSGDSSSDEKDSKKKRRYMKYDKMTILFEENAPLPPPIAASH